MRRLLSARVALRRASRPLLPLGLRSADHAKTIDREIGAARPTEESLGKRFRNAVDPRRAHGQHGPRIGGEEDRRVEGNEARGPRRKLVEDRFPIRDGYALRDPVDTRRPANGSTGGAPPPPPQRVFGPTIPSNCGIRVPPSRGHPCRQCRQSPWRCADEERHRVAGCRPPRRRA
jgi:hypothetical protein